MNYESFYPGYRTTSPSYYTPPSPYNTSIGNLGISMDPRSANQLGELNLRLNPGVKTIEIQGTFANVLESIPDQHLDEMRRLGELTGVDRTLHGPLLNASGVEQQGGFTEENRLGVEKQMESALLRAHKLDPKGNIPVTFHSSANLPSFQPHMIKDGKRIDEGLWIIDEESGQITQIRDEKRYLPEEGKFGGKQLPFDANRELEKRNKDTWLQQLSRTSQSVNFGENALDNLGRTIEGRTDFGIKDIAELKKINPNTINDPEHKRKLIALQSEIDYGQTYLKESYRQIRDLFDKAWAASTKEKGNEHDKINLKKFANYAQDIISKDFENDPNQVQQLREVVDYGLNTLSNLKETPNYFRPLSDFAIEKSAETFSNIAQTAYKKYGNTAPVITIENPPGGEALSTGEELRELVVSSRKQLTKNLQNEGMSNSEASKVASQMIGATWDVGHINMMRKKGYSEKDVIEETKKIAPFVKHVHLSDNFGLDHTELPMGMGNVPLKPMIDEIKKQGFKGKEIIEAGNWWQHFADKGGGNPFLPSIEALDSPIYAMGEGPRWSQTGAYGNYYSGHGPVNTPVHHQTYGSGFQNMPIELGGEIPGDRGRFAGAPNQ